MSVFAQDYSCIEDEKVEIERIKVGANIKETEKKEKKIEDQ